MAVTHIEEPENSVVSQAPRPELSGSNLAPKSCRFLENCFFSLHWKPREAGSNISKGIQQAQDR